MLARLEHLEPTPPEPPFPPEALVFMHGWQSGHKLAHLLLAQFLNLSRFPAHIKPFVFNWPCGVGYFSFGQVPSANLSNRLKKQKENIFLSLPRCRTPTFAICPKFNSKKQKKSMHPPPHSYVTNP